jgi:DNA-binding transcriptional regulator GbsR (MarR family)
MELAEAKERFVQTWGTLGSNWGINRTMAQVHALLLVSATALSTEEVMEQLQISRGNANMNLRTLIDWGLVRREGKTGERRSTLRPKRTCGRCFGRLCGSGENANWSPFLGL